MPSIIYRLAEALLPDYEVERELASGGMGLVFLARDVQLDRTVAIKVLRPELATAEATERFVQEARTLANVHHSHVVAIHRAGETNGFFYYVMDHVDGETLAQRLRRGPLSRAEAVKLGRDVLDALEAVHDMGVVHRDIKPSNIFLTRGQALLADFGISTSSGPQTANQPGAMGVTGTPGYMPPEQAFGWDVTPRTDLYAFAMVLYQALTGRRWAALLPEQQPDWSGLPRSLLPILRRALAWDPKDRWPDARTFRRKLWHTRTTKYRRRTLLLTLAGLAGGAAAVVTLAPRESGDVPWADLAILPFDVYGGVDSALGWHLARLARLNLETFVTVTNTQAVMAWQDSVGPAASPLGAPRALRARNAATGSLEARGDTIDIRLSVVDQRGRIHSAGAVAWDRGAGGGLEGVGSRIGLELAKLVAPDRYTDYQPFGGFAAKSDAVVLTFLEGERAFQRNAWRTAIARYRRALQLEPGFPLASWRLAEAWRWLLEGLPPPDVDHAALLTSRRGALGELDRRLVEAQMAPTIEERLRRYADAVAEFPQDGYATFLFGEEIMHRGALLGLPLDSAATLLEAAVWKAPKLGPGWDHLAWVALRLGRQEQARHALERLEEVSAPPEEVELYTPPLLWAVYAALFEPEASAALPEELLYSTTLAEYLRYAAVFGAHELMAQLGGLLLTSPEADPAFHPTATLARALALFALGRVGDALTLFEAAAALYGTPEARFQAAEWAIVPAVLGVPGVPDKARAGARSRLRGLLDDTRLGARAAWVLALDAYAGGESAEGRRLLARLEAAPHDTTARRLGRLLGAIDHASRRNWDLAIAQSDSLLLLDSAGQRGGDPFARAVLHFKRGEWYERLGRREEADAMRRWYQHMEMTFRLIREAETTEVDWALGPFAEFVRGRAALERADDGAACRHMRRVARLWAHTDEALRPLAAEAQEHAATCPQ
jgi:hypothetical protein